ncbi:hypothetical protein ACFSQ3_10710 [Sphingobacterium corticis]|uniref:Uncharacterized protein n=1 Tax=Sphingobacterium corticis TaxID=1812823 RepID=A0ABW5NNL1_9SPHI
MKQQYTPPLIDCYQIAVEHSIAASSSDITVGGNTGSGNANQPDVEDWQSTDGFNQGFNM